MKVIVPDTPSDHPKADIRNWLRAELEALAEVVNTAKELGCPDKVRLGEEELI